jgi:hypothetical protein
MDNRALIVKSNPEADHVAIICVHDSGNADECGTRANEPDDLPHIVPVLEKRLEAFWSTVLRLYWWCG